MDLKNISIFNSKGEGYLGVIRIYTESLVGYALGTDGSFNKINGIYNEGVAGLILNKPAKDNYSSPLEIFTFETDLKEGFYFGTNRTLFEVLKEDSSRSIKPKLILGDLKIFSGKKNCRMGIKKI